MEISCNYEIKNLIEMLVKNPIFSSPSLVLFEDKASDYVKKVIRQHCSPALNPYLDYKVSDLPESVKSSLKQYNSTLFEKCMDNGANLMMFLRLDFLQYFDIRRGKGPEKYTIGLARIAIGELGYFEDSNNLSDIALLKQLVLFAYNNDEVNKTLDSNLNGMNFNALKNELNDKRREHNKLVQQQLSGKIKKNTRYNVVAINSAKDAEKYGQYTSWCVTHGSYDSYAKYGSRFYFCLEDGFENVKEEVGEGCPLDNYGLSMVSVLIDTDGEPTIITTRWNHEHDGENNELLHTAEQVQNVLGIPFYETFKPYTREELKAMGIVSFDEAKERLENGENPKDIFETVTWFDDVIAVVRLNGKSNFITKERKILFDKWFDAAVHFREGFACVELNLKYNYINKEGKILSDKWFDDTYNFKDCFARVKLNGKWNFINKEGKILSDKWFDEVCDFEDGFGRVILDGKRYIIDINGNLKQT